MDQTEWVWLVHPEFGTAHRVADNPGVVQDFEDRGWTLTELSGDLDIDSPQVAAAIADVQQPEFVEQPEEEVAVQEVQGKGAAKSATESKKEVE